MQARDGRRRHPQRTSRSPASAAGSANEKRLADAIADYKEYVNTQAAELLERTTAFVAAVKAGNVAKAKSLYPTARAPWERIEPVAECFGDLDPKIDGREDVVDEGMAFTGYHRLEKDLWVDGLQQTRGAIADQLLADVKSVAKAGRAAQPASRSPPGPRRCSTRSPPGRSPARRSATRTPTSGTSTATSRAPRPRSPRCGRCCRRRTPPCWRHSTTQFAALNKQLASHRQGTTYVLYTDLTPAVKALTVALDAVSEPVSRWPLSCEKAERDERRNRASARWRRAGGSAAVGHRGLAGAGLAAARCRPGHGRGAAGRVPPATSHRPLPRRAPGRHRHAGAGPNALRRPGRAHHGPSRAARVARALDRGRRADDPR